MAVIKRITVFCVLVSSELIDCSIFGLYINELRCSFGDSDPFSLDSIILFDLLLCEIISDSLSLLLLENSISFWFSDFVKKTFELAENELVDLLCKSLELDTFKMQCSSNSNIILLHLKINVCSVKVVFFIQWRKFEFKQTFFWLIDDW